MSSLLVIGAGAIGAFFGSALSRQGVQVSVVCRSEYEAIKRSGFHIRSALLGEHRFVPQEVLSANEPINSRYDFVLLSTKVLAHEDRRALLRPALRPGTVVVLIQNGIEIEAEIQTAFPEHEIVSAVAFIAVSRTQPGEINHQAAGSLTLGTFPRGVSASAKQLGTWFEASGVPCRLTDDIVKARWQKALWNATFNPISILGGLDTATITRTAEDRAFVRMAMHEVAAVASAAGHELAVELIDKLIETTHAMPAYKSSMALDFEHGRPMEVEAILGNVVRTGRTHGVSTPTLETLYRLAKMVEAQPRSGRTAAS
jgi:2-dehydropantoate 2-reductase